MSLLGFDESTNACNSPAYLNLVEQRKKAQFFNRPPPRYNNLENNPYLQINPVTSAAAGTPVFFSKFDLDMRRKAEILKYSNNTSSTKTNNLTKAQRWAQIVNGKSNNRYSQAFINDPSSVIQECPMEYTSTTASDVPGPPMLLYDASYVPIYNLINTATANAVYAIGNKETDSDVWKLYTYSDVFSATSTSAQSIFNTMAIQNINILNETYSFSVSIPFTIYVEANLSNTSAGVYHYIDPSAVQLWIDTTELIVYYGNTVVPLSNVMYSFSDVEYDSSSNAMNIAADVSINVYTSDTTYNKFYAYGYAGVLNISNIILPTQPGYIYDMQLNMTFNATVSDSFTTYFGTNPSVYFAYVNTSYATTQNRPLNCRITNPHSADLLPEFALTGIPL